MTEPLVVRRAPADPAGALLYALCRGLALAGGLVLIAMTLMSLVSIFGRAVFSHPVPGDYELVQLGCAVSVAAFLPLCQMRGGNVIVDFFTAHARVGVRAALDALGAALLGVAAAVITWRLTAGAISLREANDQTTILGIPTWWAVALMLPSFALLAAAGFYTAWRHWRRRSGDRGDDE